MPAAPLPPDETTRLLALHGLGLLDTLPEGSYEQLLRIAAALCGTPDPWRTAPEKTTPDALPIHYISIFPFAFKGLKRRAAAARAASATRPG